MRIAFAAVAVAALAGCQMMGQPEEAPRATAQLKPTQGNKTFGEATFEQLGDNKVRVIVFAQGLKPGSGHGFHIHEVGDCSAPDATSAKGHFNPLGKPHGKPGSSASHAGDLPMLQAAKNGRAKLDARIDGITVTPGTTSIIGRAVIIHADSDDYQTQPTGNAGARLACGVIQPG